jgi:peroxiredoxin
MLSDTENNVARQFGLAYRVSEEQQTLYKRTFVNLPFINGDGSWELPIPATYMIERDATVMYAFANEDYTVRPEPEDIVNCLNSDHRG